MFLPDYQSVEDDGVRSAFREIWDDENDFADKRGLTVVEIMDAVHEDRIKGMYILGENPAMSDPDVDHARDALAKRAPGGAGHLRHGNRELRGRDPARSGLAREIWDRHQHQPASADGPPRRSCPR